MYEKYQDRGFVVLGFPCNQFGDQEPGSEAEISEFCSLTYGVTFPMFAKVDVNGPDAHPLYRWLQSEKSGLLGKRIKWNFTKFLVSREGAVVQRYGSTTTPDQIAGDIEQQLG
jgi:glutathione peroxidase